MSMLGVVNSRWNVAYFTSLGLFSLKEAWIQVYRAAPAAPRQLALA
jgi:hypothetical protein